MTTMRHALINKNSGFTLIELLLVLALVVALTAAGLFAYQIQLRNFRVDKTALQMQQWLQAGMAFRVDCGLWPVDSVANPDILLVMTGQKPLTSALCPDLKPPDQTRTYMPLGIDKKHPNGPGPWLNYYNIGPYVYVPPNEQQPPPPPTVQLFYVKTDIGAVSLRTQTNARMIAGRLPNADIGEEVVDGVNQEFVRAYVGNGNFPPGGKVGPQILDMEMVNSLKTAQHIEKPTQAMCNKFGAGMTPILVGAISGVDGDDSRSKNEPAVQSSVFNVKLDNKGYIDLSSLKDGFISPELQTVTATTQRYMKNNGRNQVLLISACLPPPANAQPQNIGAPSPSGSRY